MQRHTPNSDLLSSTMYVRQHQRTKFFSYPANLNAPPPNTIPIICPSFTFRDNLFQDIDNGQPESVVKSDVTQGEMQVQETPDETKSTQQGRFN